MRIIEFAHRLEVGGTKFNAVDFATRLRDQHGNSPILFATPGLAQELVSERGLRFEAAPAGPTGTPILDPFPRWYRHMKKREL